MKKYNVGVIGATGLVGRELINQLDVLNFPYKEIYCFASINSNNKKTIVNDKEYLVLSLNENSFTNLDIAFFCLENEIAIKYIPIAIKQNILIIDNSSLYRLSCHVPCICHNVNHHVLTKSNRLIANPNCSTAILCQFLKPFDKEFNITSCIVSTYQSLSGIGLKALNQFSLDTSNYLINQKIPEDSFAFQVFPLVGKLNSDNYSTEERKLVLETQKILEKEINIIPTCLRVPTLNCHCESVLINSKNKISLEKVNELINSNPFLEFFKENMGLNRQYKQTNKVGVGRIRIINDYSIALLLVGDNLTLGASSNAVYVALDYLSLEDTNEIL